MREIELTELLVFLGALAWSAVDDVNKNVTHSAPLASRIITRTMMNP